MSPLLKWFLIGCSCLALVFALANAYEGWRGRVFAEGDRAGAARVQSQWDEDRARAQAAAIEQARLAALETKRRLERQAENEREQQTLLARARADADRARAAADGLQLRAAAYLNAAGCGGRSGDSAIACLREAVAAIGNALGQCGAIAREAAADADDARTRGRLCEANYDSLTLKAVPP